MMPGMDGFETLRRIRDQSQMPVIMLTARAGDADRLKGFRAAPTTTSPNRSTRTNWPPGSAQCFAGQRGRAGRGRTVLHYPGVEIDLERRRVAVNGRGGAALAGRSGNCWRSLPATRAG